MSRSMIKQLNSGTPAHVTWFYTHHPSLERHINDKINFTVKIIVFITETNYIYNINLK